MKRSEIPAGARLLTPRLVCEKFSKGTNWLWTRVRNDPDFPAPCYLDGRPHWLEVSLDDYIRRKIEESTSPRGPALTAKRIEKQGIEKAAA